MAVLIAIGFVLAKKGKLSKKTAEDMTFFVFKIATPCVIIKSFVEVDFTAGYFNKLIMAAVMAVITHLLGFCSGWYSTFSATEKQPPYTALAALSAMPDL